MTSSTTTNGQDLKQNEVLDEVSAIPAYSRLTPGDRLNIIVDLILDAIEQEGVTDNVDAIY